MMYTGVILMLEIIKVNEGVMNSIMCELFIFEVRYKLFLTTRKRSL